MVAKEKVGGNGTGSSQGRRSGLGRFGKLHAGVLGRFSHVQIAAICDPVPEELAAAREQYPGVKTFADLDSMLEGAEIECLFLLITPEQTHSEQVRKAIGRGIPTFVEKPLSTTSADGAELAQLARDAEECICKLDSFCVSSQHALLKQEISSGQFGNIGHPSTQAQLLTGVV